MLQKRLNDDFSVSKLEIRCSTRNTENRLKNTKTWNCKHCWMKIIHKHKNNSQSNWALVNKLFPIAYEKWNGKIQKVCRWVPHELNERQMERRKNTCEILLERYRRKSFLHRIVTGDEKRIFFWEPQAQKIMTQAHHPHRPQDQITLAGRRCSMFGGTRRSIMSIMSYWSLAKRLIPNAINNNWFDLNRSLLKKRPEYQKRQHKVIFLYDNAPSHTAKPVRDTLEALSWKVLPHAAYSPSDYHLFASMGHALTEQRFGSYEDVKKWLDKWFAAKGKDIYWRGIHKLSERWEKCVISNGAYFE